ncbi:MAG: sulfotransferase [Proteobacteria bacterium]|nr:sulfotransferase [Pseudomonadota bacterium]
MTNGLDRMVLEAQALQRQGRVPEAIQAYQKALGERPDRADCWYNLGVLLRQQRQLPEALAAYQRALDYGISAPEEVHLNRAVIYSDYLRQDSAAEQELTQALQNNPNYIPALLNLANLHEDRGGRSEAGALYGRVLTLNPRCFEALARFANLQPAASADNRLIVEIEEALQAPAAAAEQASLLFALGRLRDGKGQYAAAFEAYTAANARSRASAAPGTATYNRKRQEDLVDQLILRYPAGAVAAAGGLEAAGTQPQPIFICGMFRSGSTLAEQLLARHPQLAAGGELDILPRLAATAAPASSLAATYRAQLRRMFPGAAYVTDKRPDNFLHIGFIKSLFPDAPIVHTSRDPLDNCLSIFFLHLDHSMAYALNLLDIGHYFRQYRRLMAHWQRCYPHDLFELNYDTFVHQPARQAARLFGFLGLDWDDRYLEPESRGRAVKTASVWQVREPIYTRSSGRAAHYRDQLGELRALLSDLLPTS